MTRCHQAATVAIISFAGITCSCSSFNRAEFPHSRRLCIDMPRQHLLQVRIDLEAAVARAERDLRFSAGPDWYLHLRTALLDSEAMDFRLSDEVILVTEGIVHLPTDLQALYYEYRENTGSLRHWSDLLTADPVCKHSDEWTACMENEHQLDRIVELKHRMFCISLAFQIE